jgi:polar amino acid transport system permease protein
VCDWRVPDRAGVGRRSAEWQSHLDDRGRRPAKCVRRRQACAGVSPIPPDRRLEREAAKRRRHRRGQAIAALSSIVILGGLATLILTSPGWPEVRETFFNWEVFEESFPDVLKAFWLDVKIFLVAELAILVVGLFVALVRIARTPAMFPMRLLSVVFVDLFRGIPTILLVFLIGFGVPALQLSGTPNDPVVLGAIALVLSYSAYVAEVYRAGINSVHRSQRDAALAVGLTEAQALRHVILPQAVRRVAPPLLNDFVALQKDVALISILGPLEAFREAQIIESLTFNFTPLVAAALLYLAVTVPTARIVDRMGGPEGAVR